LLSKGLGATFIELKELWGESVKIWRLQNQITNFERGEKLVEEQNIT